MHCVPDDLKELEGIFKAPRLYLIDYFTSIIHNIDVACEKFLISHKGIISRTQVFETHELMVERVKSIQDNCLKKLTKGWFDSSQVKEIKRTIDSLQNNETDKLLYDCKTKLFSLMFSNTMVVFLTKEKCPDLYNLGLIKSFGSLLVVQDEFIGNKAFDNLGLLWKHMYKEKNLRITADLVKVDNLITELKILLNTGRVNQIIEIHLGLSKQTTFQLVGKTFTSRLSMSDCTSRTLSSDVLNGFDNLILLNLSSCHLTSIPYGTTNNLKKLQSLNLSNNKLVAIDSTIFKELDNLESINLSYNRLSTFDKSILSGITCLREIDLSYNFLGDLDSNLFQGLVNLSKVCLSSNDLDSLDLRLFHGLVNLQTLDISRNKINAIYADILTSAGLHNLVTLNLSYNCLQSINSKIFAGLKKLQSIDLKQNQIQNIHKDLFKNLTNLSVILLSNNQLTSLDPMLLQGLYNLEEIDLANNQIVKLDLNMFNGLVSLKQIHLRGNQLKSIDSTILLSLVSLSHICLTGNKAYYSLDSNESKLTFGTFKELNKKAKKPLFKLFDNLLWSRLIRNIKTIAFDVIQEIFIF